MEEKFLPIGTVVILKGGRRELMIMSYCVMPDGQGYDKNGEIDVNGKMFDYGACFYPEGMLTSDQMFVFNHDQIEKICFKGYETDAQKEISQILIGGMEEMEKEKKESQE
ncbi:MAG: DUF4176 domain-containing protein [Bacilli bacterium]|nr:DUF4176 domain-containing protein [Bacilli bacterium]